MASETVEEKLWNSNYTKIWVANFMLYFSFMLLMPLFPLYLRDTFGADKQMIGIVLSGYTIAALLIRPFSGYLVDSFPRKAVLLVFNFCFVALFAGYIAASSLTVFAIFRTLHGIPFGATTVAGTTVAIDVLYPSRRAEGIGFYGLSNNIATAISPTIAIFMLDMCKSYELLFVLSLVVSLIGLIIDCTIKTTPLNKYANKNVNDIYPPQLTQRRITVVLGKLFLFKGWRLGLCMICFALSYGIISTYVAIYASEELDIKGGAGIFFFLLASGLILSRLTGAKGLRQGKVSHNASEGMIISMFGYLLFAMIHHPIALYSSAMIIGLGNGHMYPAFQNMFINLATNNQRGTANSTLLTSWDLGSGLGVLIGGLIAEAFSYHAAFWIMWVANLTGVIIFYAFARLHYLRNSREGGLSE